MKALLDCRNESVAENNDNMVLELRSTIETLKQEIESLKEELQKADDFYDEKLTKTEVVVEQLNVELEIAKIAEASTNGKVKDYEVEAINQRNIELELKLETETLKQLEKANEHEDIGIYRILVRFVYATSFKLLKVSY